MIAALAFDAGRKEQGRLMRSLGAPRIAVLGSVALAGLTAPPAGAVDGIWQGAGNEWTTGANWSSRPAVPDNLATFQNNGAPTSVTISNSASINTMRFEAAAPAYSFAVQGGATFTINNDITNLSSFQPGFTVNRGSTLAVGDGADITIGTLGDGISGGGTVQIGAGNPFTTLFIASSTSSTFSGSFSGAGGLELDNPGTTLTLTGASNGGNIGVLGGDLTLCSCFAGGLTIDGGTLTVASPDQGVGVLGGTLSVLNGGKLNITQADLLVGTTMLISGRGSAVSVADATGVGIFGPGTLTISNGGSLNSQGGAEIDAFTGRPSAAVSGAGSTWTIAGAGFTVGGGSTGGPGTLTISAGGTVNVTHGLAVGDAFDGSSLVTVTDMGSQLNVDQLRVGQTCDCTVGTLTVANGAVVNATTSIRVGVGSTLNLGNGGLAGSIVTPSLIDNGRIVANFTDTLTLGAAISGSGSLSKTGSGTLILSGNNSYAGGTTVTGGLVNFATAGNFGTGAITLNGAGLQWAAGTTTDISPRLAALGANGGIFDTNGNNVTLATTLSGAGGLTKTGSGTLTLAAANTYAGGTTINGGRLAVAADNNFGSAAGGLTFNGGTLSLLGDFRSDRAVTLNAGGAHIETNTHILVLSQGITGIGGLSKDSPGALFLIGNNTYTGGTVVNAGILHIGNEAGASGSIVGTATVNGPTSHLAFLSQSSAGNLAVTLNGGTMHFFGNSTAANATITVNDHSTAFVQNNGSGGQARFIVNSGGAFDISGLDIAGTTAGSIEGAGAIGLGSKQLTVGGNNLSTTFAGPIVDGGLGGGVGGSLVKVGTGTLTLTAGSSFTGGITLNAGGLVVNGSLASGVTMNGGTLGGNGTIGGLVANAGIVAPGNSIGTLTVNGNLVQNAGSIYQVEVNSAGQGDRINVAGTAAINGASVQVLAQSGQYARNATYTILNAAGGVSGTYSSVSSNFAFLTPSLSYDPNNVYLTLFQPASAFAAGAQTPNQYAVGVALDQANAAATGDFATVLNALSVLSTQQGPAALNAISGQQYADFGTMNIQGAVLFMNTVGQQMAVARNAAGSAVGGQRQALAEACDVGACDATGPWSAWASALGGLGTVAGNGNSSTLTYNFGGGAAGIDYRVDPRFLVGVGAGYAAGNQWVDSFMGRGWTDTVSAIAYGSFMQAGFYADALAGYAWSGNQLQRQILIPGLQPRTANGSTGANQFLGQVETGYRIGGIFAPAAASVTPFARLQGSTVTQNAFTEWGANSLDLNVAQQTTNSLRTTFGADLAGEIGLGDERKLALDLRLGWLHEYANTGRPITAAFAGAPVNAFTVYGATPQRDSAIIGFSAGTRIVDAAQIYLRYDGEIGSAAANHTLNLGVRFSW
jgi:outer membrane autotransporter protein